MDMVFIREYYMHTWPHSAYAHASRAQRKNLQKDDVYKAVGNTDIFDFLEMVLKVCESANLYYMKCLLDRTVVIGDVWIS